MVHDLAPLDRAKLAAARRASDLVEDGMKLGLGTGSTAAWMVRCLAEKAREEGLRLICVPTSLRTATLARELGLKVVALEDAGWLDLTIDGADEFDEDLVLIKGGGGALLQEKIVATASDRMVVISDATKEVRRLGAFPLPVEVIPFGWQTTRALVEETLTGLDVMGRTVNLRMEGEAPFRSDEGNYILDLGLRRIGNPRQLSLVLNQIPGVVENGLFIDICDRVIVGHPDGRVAIRDAETGTQTEDWMPIADAENLFRDG